MLAGVNGTDPFVLMPQFLAELKAMGFSGVQNFPTIGLFDGAMRQSFEETGMGYGLEVDMIAAGARARPPDHALRLQSRTRRAAMTKAGADIIVAHMGVTTGGSIGATSAKTPRRLRRARSTRSPRPPCACARDVIVLCHGGPIAMPEDAATSCSDCPHLPRLLRRLEHGAPAGETALTEQTRTFKAMPAELDRS